MSDEVERLQGVVRHQQGKLDGQAEALRRAQFAIARRNTENDRLREAATRFRRAATLVARTSEITLIQWPSSEVDTLALVYLVGP